MIEHNAFKVVRAAVALVCSLDWNPTTDEELALQQVLRDIGWVEPPCAKGGAHFWGTGGASANAYCKKCFVERPR